MNRPIKFRAWEKSAGFMIQDVGSIEWFTDGSCVVNYKNDSFPCVELMQFTGLLDKNGEEVYEGDIVVCYANGCRHTVIWRQELGGTFIGGMPGWYLDGLKEGYAWSGKEEVVGNIYENPELLK